MRILCLAALTSAVFLLFGCKVGPNYEAPVIEPPPEFVSQEILNSLSNESVEAVPTAWWEGFNDPQLDRLVENALEDNLEIGIAAAELREARAGVKLAGSGDELQMNAGVDGSLERQRRLDIEEEEPTNIETLSGFISFVLPIDLFGRTARRVEAAEANIEAAESELRRLVLLNSSEVVREYLSLRGNQRQLELLRESVELQEKTLSIVQTRFDTGLAPELDVQRAETSVQRLYADIPPLEEALLNSRNRLATLTGYYPGVYEEELSESKDIPEYASGIPDFIPVEVLMRRPDVANAEARMREAVAKIGIAEAELYPTLDLIAPLSLTATSMTGAAMTTELLVGSITAALSQTILDGGAREANIEIAEAQAEAAVLTYRQSLLEAIREVETSLANLNSSLQSQKALEAAVRSSSRSFDQAETLYQQGLISFLDVVDAQRVLADAEQALAAEKTRYATQVAVLFRALGVDTPAVERGRVFLPVEDEDRDRE